MLFDFIYNLVKNKVKSLFAPTHYGLSFNNEIKIKKLPIKDIGSDSVFYKLNDDLGIFEVTSISKKLDKVYITEIGTDNEFVLNYKLFEFLFTNIPIPKEVQF